MEKLRNIRHCSCYTNISSGESSFEEIQADFARVKKEMLDKFKDDMVKNGYEITDIKLNIESDYDGYTSIQFYIYRTETDLEYQKRLNKTKRLKESQEKAAETRLKNKLAKEKFLKENDKEYQKYLELSKKFKNI